MTPSVASSVGMSSGKDEGMSSQSTLHQCLAKVKDVQEQVLQIYNMYLQEKSLPEKQE